MNRPNISRTFKKGGETLWRRTHHLIKLIWVQHKMLEEWSMGITQPIYKKGDKLECSNYRVITLLNVTYKVLSGILYNRLTVYPEEILGEYQRGFRANCSTIDLPVLEAILQKINITGHIGTKSTQILAYADDVVIVGRNKNVLKDTP